MPKKLSSSCSVNEAPRPAPLAPFFEWYSFFSAHLAECPNGAGMPLANNKPAEGGGLDKKKTVTCAREEQAAGCLHRLFCAFMEMHGRIHKQYGVGARSEGKLVARGNCGLGDGYRVPAPRLSRQYEPCICSDGGVRRPLTRGTGNVEGSLIEKEVGLRMGAMC